jgi:hypothetical protein
MRERSFPVPWSIEENTERFIVKDATGQALGYFYYDEEPQRRSVDKRLAKDEARQMAVNFAKLPELTSLHASFQTQIYPQPKKS